MPSSVIARLSYDAAGRTLKIVFQSGEVYEYYKVPRTIYDAFIQSGSKGKFLNQRIKGNFRYKKLSG